MKKITKYAHLLYEVGTMRKTPRAHMQTLLTSDLSDNIASHSYRVTVIGLILAEMEKVDVNKVITMCLLHDIAEARSGDQNWVHKKYVKTYEDEIHKEQIVNFPNQKHYDNILSEYQKRESLESKIAKDADLIDQILLLKEYSHQGNKEADLWLSGHGQLNRISTKSGKLLAKEIYNQKPSDWWNDIWTEKRR